MRTFRVLICTVIAVVMVAGLTHAQEARSETGTAQASLSTTFTYQGHLADAEGPIDGTCTFWFSLYDEAGIGIPPSGGQRLDTHQVGGVRLREGNFTVALDFGSGVFTGERRWLEIDVDCGEGAVTLSPRQELTAAPYAFYAPSAGAVPWSGVADVPGGLEDGDDDTLGALTGSCTHGQIVEWNEEGQAWACGDDDSGAPAEAWLLAGNAGTDPGTHFIGTSDAVDVRLAVNGTTALRLEASGGTPNIVGGDTGNSAGSGVVGATIGGGGYSSYPNGVTEDYGTVGGGAGNSAGGAYATVGGGTINAAEGSYAIVGGGRLNRAGGAESAIGGGKSNVAEGAQATISGGLSNEAKGDYSAVGGGQLNASRGQYATVGGGYWITATGDYATVGGGKLNEATGTQSTVGGGADNHAGYRATVAGGLTNQAEGSYSIIGGGHDNRAAASYAAVLGGKDNEASGDWAAVAGGSQNVAQGTTSFAAGHRAEARHNGAFVWADRQGREYVFPSTADNEFSARATGGVRFVVGIYPDGSPRWTCSIVDGSSWACTSDRNMKENLELVEGTDTLERLSQVPIYRWNAAGRDPVVQHVGPMAQDFHAAFAVGEDERQIATIDLDGVALAAIQGLRQLSQDQAARIERLEAETADLQAAHAAQQERIDQLVARLDALETGAERGSASNALPGMGAILAAAVVVWRANRGAASRAQEGDR